MTLHEKIGSSMVLSGSDFIGDQLINFYELNIVCETPQICCHTSDNLILISILGLVMITSQPGKYLDEETFGSQIVAFVHHTKCLLPPKFSTLAACGAM